VRKKTYRVFVHDGEQAQILYASKILSFQGLQKILDIHEVLDIKDQELISIVGTEERKWWSRDLGKEKVLFFGSAHDVSMAFRNGLNSSVKGLNRSNGKARPPIIVNKGDDN